MAASDLPPGAQVDDSDTMQLVRQAVLFENTDLLGDLLAEHKDAAVKMDRYGRTPLMLAAHNGRAKSLEQIIFVAPDTIDMQGGGGKTALHFATESGEAGCVAALLSAGADYNLLDFAGHCALEMAQMTDRTNVAEMLMQHIQDDSERIVRAHAEMLSCCASGELNKVESLLNAATPRNTDTLLNGRGPDAQSALFVACQNGRLEVVRKLLDIKEKHVVVQPQTLDTVLHAAISSQDVEVLRLMLEKFPALISNSNVDGSSCLHWAARTGSVDVVKCILEFPYEDRFIKDVETNSGLTYRSAIEVNVVDSECRTALYLAVANGHKEIVEYMLNYTVEFSNGTTGCPFQVDVYCVRGRTPLMVAAYNRHINLITLLLSHGADVNLPLGVLEAEEESVEEARCIGSGALSEAARADALNVVHHLLTKGAVDTDNKALQIASQNKSEKIVRVLLCRLAHPDPEYKVNKKNVEMGQMQIGQSLLPSSLCPSKAAMLSWAGAGLDSVQSDWFISAALNVNTRLKTTRLALAAITRVDLSHNKLTVFPSLLFQMPSLRSVNVSANKLKSVEVPSYYISSSSLEILILKENQIECLSPQLLCAFPCLHTLDISHNRISALPEFIWLCPSLKELNAAHNLLTSLPIVNNRSRLLRTANIGQLHSESNGDVMLPPNVAQKTLNRDNLWMQGVALSKVDHEELFPDEPVTSSSTLNTLILTGNKLQIFPNCLACTCPRLLTLNMSHNLLTQLAPIQCLPAHLRSLDVSHNKLRDLFPRVSPPHLVCHAVPAQQNPGRPSLPGRRNSPQRRHNRSRSKSAVRSQRSLSLSRGGGEANQMSEEACVHKRHDTLEWMKTFNAAGNCLTSLHIYSGEKVLLPGLTVLDVSDNQLCTVPAILAKIGSMSVLNLSGNSALETLPPELGVLSRLWSLSLKGCRLKEPLNSMVNSEHCKTVEIVAYLKTILEESKTFRHLKLVILGGPSTGRSTLWEAVRSEGVSKRPPCVGGSVRVAEFKLEPKKKDKEQLGPVSFSAWDFICDRREYSAIHQYVLTRRAVYVVTFKVTDGAEAVAEVEATLINIQARAPNACALVVGTHADQVSQNPQRFPERFLIDLEERLRDRIMIPDADKRGMPRVTDVILLNAKSRNDTRTLCQAIYRTAWETRSGKERAVGMPVPSSYVALIKVLRAMAAERHQQDSSSQREPPVLSIDQLREKTAPLMKNKFGRTFRDDVEFNAAVSFLHDCGEIVHFEDASLRAVYVYDAVWMCDLIANAVDARGPHKPQALVTVDKLQNIFRHLRSVDGVNIRTFIVDLLHKCEVALVCHSRTLLVSCHLPDEYRLRVDYQTSLVKLDLRIASWRVRYPAKARTQLAPLHSLLFRTSLDERSEDLDARHESPVHSNNNVVFQFAYKREGQLRRLYAMSYVPSGFWPRLITRVMGDANVTKAVEQLFWTSSQEDTRFLAEACRGRVRAEWVLWQTGIELVVKGHSLVVFKQFLPHAEVRDINYAEVDWMSRNEQKQWRPTRIAQSALVEMMFPSLTISVESGDRRAEMHIDAAGSCALLALLVDLLDTLLEDWYPSLGTRFVHSSEGDLLVSRFVPCGTCAEEAVEKRRRVHDDQDLGRERKDSHCPRSKTLSDMPHSPKVYAFSAEELMLAARGDGIVECPSHGAIQARTVAPDTFFVDIEGDMLIACDSIRRGRLLGRGAFGFVFRTTLKTASGEMVDAAQKMLEPVNPGAGGRPSAIAAYKAGAAKWERDSLEYACRAYCTSRQELSLLSRMRHPNVICLLGVCPRPLSLVVELAPLGALNHLIASYRKSGCRLAFPVVRDTATQVARAIEYLHQQHIIYRDLKSENVLAWRFPPPFSPVNEVLVKLGDYGISRSILPSGGAKGFGGTEGFMAPEIVRFNGEEEYTQKVDCFSFGMFLYELLTLKLPFEGEEHVKERLLDGARPLLLPHELLVPCGVLDLLVLCWSPLADSRPSSSHIVSLCTAPEFAHILDVVNLGNVQPPTQLASICTSDETEEDELEGECWLCVDGAVSVLSCNGYGWIDMREVSPEGARASWVGRIRETLWVVLADFTAICYSPSLHEIHRMQLDVDSALIRPPELFSSDILCLMTCASVYLYRLEETGQMLLIDRVPTHAPTYAAVLLGGGESRQIWTGHPDGVISAHHISSEDKFQFASSLSHPEALGNQCLMEKNRDGNSVWTATDQSSRVFCWDVDRKSVSSTLDVKKVMPASETIYTIDTSMVDDTVVTALKVHEADDASWLYIGTSTGVLVLANAYTLQPFTACRPYGGSIRALCILEGCKTEEQGTRHTASSQTSESVSSLTWMRERVSETVERFRSSPAPSTSTHQSVLVSIGTKYRSLTNRFMGAGDPPKDTTTAIVWRTDDWL